MLMIRFQRVGRKNDPSFRVVVTDSHNGPRSGRFLEIVGAHNPKTNQTELKAERIKHWMEHGAKASDTLHNLLVSKGIIKGKKINVLPKKTPPQKEAPAAEAVPVSEAASAASEAAKSAEESAQPSS